MNVTSDNLAFRVFIDDRLVDNGLSAFRVAVKDTHEITDEVRIKLNEHRTYCKVASVSSK